MKNDKMTNRERWEAVIKGEKPDRVPVFAWMHDHIALINGLINLNTDPAIALRAHKYAQELYGYDSPPLFIGKFELGGMLMEKKGEIAKADAKTVQTEEDALKLIIPEEIHKTSNVSNLYEFSQLMDKEGLPEITFFIRDPFSMASTLLGIDSLMFKLIEGPEIVHIVMRKCTELVVKLIETWVKEFGPERLMPVFASALTSNKLISPKHFEEFVLPYEKTVFEKLTDLGVTKGIAHLCSEQKKNLPYWGKIRMPERIILSFGHEVYLKDAASALPCRIIAGNVDPIMFLENDPKVIFDESRRAIEDGKDIAGGYFLMPGCDVPPKATPVSMFQMIAAAREFGQY